MAKNGENGSPAVGGSLDQELAHLKEDLHLSNFVLFIGFAGVFIAVYLFAVQALVERNASYNSLLERITVLETKINNSCPQ